MKETAKPGELEVEVMPSLKKSFGKNKNARRQKSPQAEELVPTVHTKSKVNQKVQDRKNIDKMRALLSTARSCAKPIFY